MSTDRLLFASLFFGLLVAIADLGAGPLMATPAPAPAPGGGGDCTLICKITSQPTFGTGTCQGVKTPGCTYCDGSAYCTGPASPGTCKIATGTTVVQFYINCVCPCDTVNGLPQIPVNQEIQANGVYDHDGFLNVVNLTCR